MDELETLNMLLRAIGSSPVNSTSTNHPDAGNALATMNRIRRRVQRRGWWFNLEYNVRIQPDDMKMIILPSNWSSTVFESSDLTQRKNKAYNKFTQTDRFDEEVLVVRATRIDEWDDMPEIMTEYCAYYAAAEFVRDELEDQSKEASFRESASASYLDLKKQDLEEGQYNVFKNPRVARARGGIRPYERRNNRFFGDPDV